MGSVVAMFRAEFHRRWPSWLALALLVTLIGGTVLAGVSTARRTSSAFDSFSRRYGYDAEIFSTSPLAVHYLRLPYITEVTTDLYYANGNGTADGHFVPNQDLGVASLPTTHFSTTIKLLSGRLPTGAHDALVGFSMQAQFGLRIGSTVTVPFYNESQRKAVVGSNSYVVPHGPRVRFRVVGFEVSETDFPSSSSSYSLFTSPAFDHGVGSTIVSANVVQLRTRHGQNDMPQLQVYVNHHQPRRGFAYLQNIDSSAASVAQSIQPQSTGWWIFALFALLAGLALVGQALSRQSLVERESYPTLSALGMRPRQLFALGMVRAAAIGVAGAVGGVALAYAISPLTPVGEARAAEPIQGFVFNAVLFGLGALAVVAAVLLLALVPSWRAAQGRGASVRETPVGHANAAVALVSKTGAPPSVMVGVRNALDRGRGRSSVPVATALVGATVGVMALVATTVFGASLTHLVTTPPLYGQNWQLDMGNMTTPQMRATLATLDSSAYVTKITYGFSGKYLRVGSVPVEGIFVYTAKGPMAFSLVNGRYPTGDDQLALGATTMSQAHLHVGSRTSVALITKSGQLRSRTMQVVGTVTLPPTFSIGGLGVGAVLPMNAALDTACLGVKDQTACHQKLLRTVQGWGMAVGIAPGAAGHEALARFDQRFSQFVNVFNVPTNLVNFGQAVDFPLLLGVTLALFGAATLAHLLFVSVARRRRQVALLKVLGFVRRQVLVSTWWQALTVIAVGLAIGVPSGIVVGESVWRLFASHLGAVPVAVVPAGLVVAVCAVIIVGGFVLALLPAILAVRVQPAEALRED